MPYQLLRNVLALCPAAQLRSIETLSPHLLAHSEGQSHARHQSNTTRRSHPELTGVSGHFRAVETAMHTRLCDDPCCC